MNSSIISVKCINSNHKLKSPKQTDYIGIKRGIAVFNSSTSHHNSFLMETLTKSSLLKLIKKTSFTLCSKVFQDVMTMREKNNIYCVQKFQKIKTFLKEVQVLFLKYITNLINQVKNHLGTEISNFLRSLTTFYFPKKGREF